MKRHKFSLLLFFLMLIGLIPSPISAKIPSKQLEMIESVLGLYQQRARYDGPRLERIAAIQNKLAQSTGPFNIKEQYELQYQLLGEFYSFKSHEAFDATLAMERLAQQLHDTSLLTHARLHKADVLICAGLFNEASHLLNDISLTNKSSNSTFYYQLMTRLYGDLKNYNDVNHYNHRYQQLNGLYTDSLLLTSDPSSVEHLRAWALKAIDENNAKQALERCHQFLADSQVDDHQRAMVYSTMAWAAEKQGDPTEQATYLMESIRCDIRSSTYETTSGRKLAQLLLENGETELAHRFVLEAIKEAEHYGARQRKAEITHIVPIIEQQLKEVQQIKSLAIAGFVAILGISLVTITILMIRLSRRHKQLKGAQQKLNHQNDLLSKQNHQLAESNKIKEEYLTGYFELSSIYFHEMEKMKEKIGSWLVQKKHQEIAHYLEQQQAQEGREQLLNRFDALFLSLFPTFVDAIQSILGPGQDNSSDLSKERLSAELRVIALFRLGIDNTDRVASILGVSRNTIYNYRNRIKAKTNLSAAQFDTFILAIPSR
ncbi:MAG: DUF6377 domain-containing protein [Breznakibacter sp.]